MWLLSSRSWELAVSLVCFFLQDKEQIREGSNAASCAGIWDKWGIVECPEHMGQALRVCTDPGQKRQVRLGCSKAAHTQFESPLFTQLCELWGGAKSRTTLHHPQSNSVVERENNDLGDALRAIPLRGDDERNLKLSQIMWSTCTSLCQTVAWKRHLII